MAGRALETQAAGTDRLATSHQVAEYLQVGEKRVRAWRYEGLGPAWIKTGRLVRYRWPDVESWLQDQTRGSEVRAG